MSAGSKADIMDISVKTTKILICVLLAFSAFLYVYAGYIKKTDNWKKEPFEFIESWIVTDDQGNEFKMGRSYDAKTETNREYTISSTLPGNIRDNEYLFFDTRRDVEVYIGGEFRGDFVEKRDISIPQGSIKRFFMSIPLNEADSGAEVRIEIKSTVKDEQIVPCTFITTKYGLFGYLMEKYGLTFFLASIILIFSIVVFIVSVVLRFRYELKIDMLYGAIGILGIAAWIITDSFLFPYIYGAEHVNGMINYILSFMIPLALGIYLDSVHRGRYRKSMTPVLIVALLCAVVFPTLHFAGVIHLYNARMSANLVLAGFAVYGIAILIIDAASGHAGEYRYTFVGFFGFLTSCFIELMLLILVTSIASFPMLVGLAFLLVFVVIQQIDDLRKVNIEKQHAIRVSEAKTRFLASMSHEIRTPINAILGMNEMILRENRDEVIAEYSNSIKSSGKMLLMLINDVLDFSKIEAGKLEINENSFYMSEMLRDVLSMVGERADEKSLDLKTEITDEIPDRLISDEFRIRQILVNIINNAVKYTDRGTVTLQLGGHYTDAGYELAINVKDTGRGIRKEDQDHLFEAFSRADIKANAHIEGTGLGLAIVKSIVDSMNGSIGVESKYGVGSEFWVKLPVRYLSREPLKSDFMERRSQNTGIPAAVSFKAPEAMILAVDDNQSNLTIVKLFLKQTGIIPDLCSSGSHAIELCREKKYDLILLDHMMPEPDGIETLHIIRNDERSLNRDTKAVVLTANVMEEYRKTYKEAGFDGYMTKPLDPAIFEQTLKNMLPQEKVIEASSADRTDTGYSVLEFMPQKGPVEKKESPIKKKLTSIDGLDYDTALAHCANNEGFLEEYITVVANGCGERCVRMRKSLADKDLHAYEIEAHTIKSTMASIGLKGLSERAKKHETAAKNNDTEFIFLDAEDFIIEYNKVCEGLK